MDCQQVDDTMALILDGTAPDAQHAHIEDCDRCRDARHAAAKMVALTTDAGLDYVHPGDFVTRIEAGLRAVTSDEGAAGDGWLSEDCLGDDARHDDRLDDAAHEDAALGDAASDAVLDDERGGDDRVGDGAADDAGAAGATQPMAARSGADVAGQGATSPTAAALTGDAGRSVASAAAGHQDDNRTGALRWLRRPRNTLLVGLAAAALVAATVALVMGPGVVDERPVAEQAWQGRVVTITRAGGGGGLEICRGEAEETCTTASEGTSFEAGSRLRTDGRTRAHLELTDGTKLALDRATEVVLSAAHNRRAELTGGAIVADVAKLEGSTARVDLPRGYVEVLGTKFGLRSHDRTCAVDVSRGSVKLFDEDDRAVLVRAGEEGRSFEGVPPYATAAPRLAEALSWSEEGDDEEMVVRGLGELRAQKPGGEERKGAVRLTSHQVKVRIVDGFARTEIDEKFTNDTDEVLEGIYRFPLPPDAKIERLALEVDGRMEEGAFVGRDRAAKIWRGAIVNANRTARRPREEIIWVPGPWKDPALLEWQRGGRFELRIFPIPKKGARRVVLTYTQAIPATAGARRFVYPLPHDPSGSLRVDDFGVDIQVRGHDPAAGVTTQGYSLSSFERGDMHELSLTQQQFVPTGDLVVEYALPDRDSELSAYAYQPEAKPTTADAAGAPSEADGGGFDDTSPYVALALRPQLPRSEQVGQRAYVLVVDASRSMFGERFRRAAVLTSRVVMELDRGDRFTVLACDTTCRRMPGAGGLLEPSGEAAAQVKTFLDGITPEGGSDVAAAIREASAIASGGADAGSLRVVYIGDGTPTVGPIRPGYMTDAVARSVPRGRGTVTTVAIGADSDLDALAAVARGGGGVVLPYIPGRKMSEAAYAVLGASYGMGLRDVSLELPDGLVAMTPARIDTIAPGSETLVFARMTRPDAKGDVVLRGRVGDTDFEQRYPLDVRAVTGNSNAFVPRLYAAARIADLERQGDADARARAVELSGDFNVASRYTSLLVLESPAMFRAFGLDNKRTTPVWRGESDADKSDADDDRAASGPGRAEGGGKKAEKTRLGSSGEAKRDSADFEAPDDMADNDPAFGPGGDSVNVPRVSGGSRMPAPLPSAVPSPFSTPPATEPMAPPPPPRPTSKAGCARDDLMCNMRTNEQPPQRQQPTMRRRPQRMVPMRRVFERVGVINTATLVPHKARSEAIAQAEGALSGNDNRRAAVKELYVLYALAGEVDRAAALAERWSSKEALDPEALTARADMAARRGDRAEAIRILGSVVDVRPGDVPSQKRLARLHRWAGAPALGCRHAIAIAQLHPDDDKLLAEAVHCGRKTGEAHLVDAMLRAASDETRKGAERQLSGIDDAEALRGEVRLEATWSGGADVDLALLHPDGHRVSWLGAPTRALISATNVNSRDREGLALLGSKAGEYVIEVVRGAGAGRVSGEIVVRAPKATRRIPFTIEPGQQRVSVGVMRIRFESRLVRAFDVGRW